jgi:hypothetical protein
VRTVGIGVVNGRIKVCEPRGQDYGTHFDFRGPIQVVIAYGIGYTDVFAYTATDTVIAVYGEGHGYCLSIANMRRRPGGHTLIETIKSGYGAMLGALPTSGTAVDIYVAGFFPDLYFETPFLPS